MILKIFKNINTFKKQFNTNQLSSSFVISKMFRKLFDDQKLKKQKVQPETYSAQPQKVDKKEEQKQEGYVYDTNYDFFARQKQMELNKDYRKIREQIRFIPEDVGKGGFDEVVYWSQAAKTPQQIIDLVKVFNRIQVPEQIADKLRFQQFGDNVMKTMYLASDIHVLQQYATFGQKFNIKQPVFWQKIQEKTIRTIPKTPSEIKDCIEIAFIMSKMKQGQIIYSSLFKIFKQLEITAQQKAKLLIIYANTQTGQKLWIQSLIKDLAKDLSTLKKQILVQTLIVFKKTKNLPDNSEKKIYQSIESKIGEFNFREICLVGGFIGHGKMTQQFWKKLEKRVNETLPEKKSIQKLLFLLELLSSYSLSTQFVKKQFLPLLRFNKYKYLYESPPQILSGISKILYIYQLEKQSEDIEQIIQTVIIKTFTYLKNVQPQTLIQVLKDYTVTRNGSRQLYIFLEQVADAMLPEVKKNRQQLQTICALYEKSQLCTPEFLSKLQNCL